ncbi:MAG: fumarylacetoacetate hydrolase family protein [Anaerolineae bacterium]|jgi:2-keto-4-pentenoate hydratase/2-oxohepta-3-ene-1,7-dioic acid hydratase in catechol pathway
MTEAPNHLVRVVTEEGPRYGAIVDEQVHCLEGDPFDDWELGEEMGPLDELSLFAPVVPSKIVCVGLNYPAHADESSVAVPSEPLLFFKPPSAVIGPNAAIVLPPHSERVDYEAELVVVIGRRCRNVRPEEAWDYVLGVTCGNDVTARDLQQLDDQWTRAKGFDTFCPLGPWIVVGLCEDDVANLEIACRVNGKQRQAGRTSEMAFSPTELIAYTSSIMTLEPGDAIMTGTPEGVGPLAAGDVVEVQVQRIGVLRNSVRNAGSGAP